MGYYSGELEFEQALENLPKMPKQKEFLTSQAFGAAYVGGEGSGKSVALCTAAIMHAF